MFVDFFTGEKGRKIDEQASDIQDQIDAWHDDGRFFKKVLNATTIFADGVLLTTVVYEQIDDSEGQG